MNSRQGHRGTRITFFMLCAVMMNASLSAAQDPPGAVYVSGGVSLFHQAAIMAGSPPPFAAPGGTTVGAVFAGGVFLPRNLSLEADVSRTGVMRSRQEGRHNTSEVATRQDWFVNVGLKAHIRPLSYVGIEPVAGIVLIGTEGTFSSFSGDSRGYFPLAWTPGLMFGVDFRIGGRRVAVVPGVRFAFAGVPNGERCLIGYSGQPLCGEDERWDYYYPQWTQRPSLSLRVNF